MAKDKFTTMGIGLLRDTAKEMEIDASGSRKALLERIRQEDMDRCAGKLDAMPMAKVPAEGVGAGETPEQEIVRRIEHLQENGAPEERIRDLLEAAGVPIATPPPEAEPGPALAMPTRPSDATRQGARHLLVELEPEELAELAADIANDLMLAAAIEARRATMSKELGDEAKGRRTAADRAAKVYRAGGEERRTVTTIHLWHREGVAAEVRADTGAIVEVRPLRQDERQSELPLAAEPEVAAPELEGVIWRGACSDARPEGDLDTCTGDVEIFTLAKQGDELLPNSDGWFANVGDVARCRMCGLLFKVTIRPGETAPALQAIESRMVPGEHVRATRAAALRTAAAYGYGVTAEQAFPGDDGGELLPPPRPSKPGAEVTA